MTKIKMATILNEKQKKENIRKIKKILDNIVEEIKEQLNAGEKWDITLERYVEEIPDYETGTLKGKNRGLGRITLFRHAKIGWRLPPRRDSNERR